jgi:hypothetical protein
MTREKLVVTNDERDAMKRLQGSIKKDSTGRFSRAKLAAVSKRLLAVQLI